MAMPLVLLGCSSLSVINDTDLTRHSNICRNARRHNLSGRACGKECTAVKWEL